MVNRSGIDSSAVRFQETQPHEARPAVREVFQDHDGLQRCSSGDDDSWGITGWWKMTLLRCGMD